MVGALSFWAEATSRSARMLRTALGTAIAAWLEDPAVVEVMLNPDGRLWIDRLADGLADTGERLSAADGERIVRLVAHHVGAEVHSGSPRVSAELPETGERFEGLIPPVVTAPTFAIRKPAVAVFTLDDYVAAHIMLPEQAAVLRLAVQERRNVLVAGGTSTGLFSSRTRVNSNANRRIWWPYEPRMASLRCPILCARRFGYVPIVFQSERCAALKLWIS
jgi:type IV secretion system protein VirB11